MYPTLTTGQFALYNDNKDKILDDLSKVSFNTIVWKGYKVFKENHSTCKIATLTVSYVAWATLLTFSSAVSAYGSIKAYLEFHDEGGFFNQGGSIGGHFAEWWPRSLYYLSAAIAPPIYVFFHLGRYKTIEEVSNQVIEGIDDEAIKLSLKEFRSELAKNNRFDSLPFVNSKKKIQAPQEGV